MAFCTGTQGGSHGIKRLDRENYRSWVRYMEAILEEEGLLIHATGSAAAPDPQDNAATANFLRLRRKCRNKLILSINEELLDVVGECDTPHEIWSKLEGMFQPKTRLRRLQAYKDFINAKLLPGEDMQIFVDRVRRLLQDAVRAGCERPSDETLCYMLLVDLPE